MIFNFFSKNGTIEMLNLKKGIRIKIINICLLAVWVKIILNSGTSMANTQRQFYKACATQLFYTWTKKKLA